MRSLTSELRPVHEADEALRDRMFALMLTCYEGMDRVRFEEDLAGKDEIILLYNETASLQGFSTQVELEVAVGDRTVRGVFSGDTVIAPESWGSGELFRRFAQTYCTRAVAYREQSGEELYWFLISKGQRTYRILPTFYKRFYPRRQEETPAELQAIMHAFGEQYFGLDYDASSGVIRYSQPKDKLLPGVAEPDPTHMKQPDVRFFVERNPGWSEGHDLVCLTSLHPDNLRFPERMLT